MLRNRDLSFWTPVNFEVEYFLNEETEGVLTETVIYSYDQHPTWLYLNSNLMLPWVSPFKLKQSQRMGMDSVSDICK